MGDLIARYEAIQETLGRLTSYAYLVYCTAMDDAETAQFFQTVREETTASESRLLFLTLELNRIEDDALASELPAPALARYAPWVRDVRAFRPFQLSDEVERLAAREAGRRPRGLDAPLRRDHGGASLPRGRRIAHQRRGAEPALGQGRRRAQEAAQAIGGVLGENVRTFALITNTLARTRRSRTSGAASRGRSPRAISATGSRTRWWTR